MLKDNLTDIEKRICIACEKSGRKRSDVTLIGVTKTITTDRILELTSLGVTDLGENRVQELLEKYEAVPNAEWHLIGHLQTNKVKFIVGKVKLIHSLDSLALAKEIDKRYANANQTANVLVEVNVAGEGSKFGLTTDETADFITELRTFPNINVNGLMTVAPYVANPEENRIYFRKLRELSIDIFRKNNNNLNTNPVLSVPILSIPILSMGMTNDYETAIEEGATMIRIGTGIFGDRM
jgi:hypothetical protein